MFFMRQKSNFYFKRHFKLLYDKNICLTSDGFMEWVKDYDNLPFKDYVFSNKNYDYIITSSLNRAIKSANYYSGKQIIQTPLFDEVKIAPIFKTHKKLPLTFWLFSARLAWLFFHKSQPENILQTIKRAKECKEFLKSFNGDVLVISHGFFMVVL